MTTISPRSVVPEPNGARNSIRLRVRIELRVESPVAAGGMAFAAAVGGNPGESGNALDGQTAEIEVETAA